MKGAQLSRSQNNIISQSEVDWGGSWENVLQPLTFLCCVDARVDITPKESRMESKFMNPGEDALLVDEGLKNKWRWAWIEEIGKDSIVQAK